MATFRFDELVEDMQSEIHQRIALDPKTSFIFSLTSKMNHALFAETVPLSNINNSDPISKAELMSLALSEGRFPLFQFVLEHFGTSLEKEFQGPLDTWIALIISNGHVDFLSDFFLVYSEKLTAFTAELRTRPQGLFVQAGLSASPAMIDYVLSHVDPIKNNTQIRKAILSGLLRAGATEMAQSYISELASARVLEVDFLYRSALADCSSNSLKFIIANFDPNLKIASKLHVDSIEEAVQNGNYLGLQHLLSLPCGPSIATRLQRDRSILSTAIVAQRNRSEIINVLLGAGVQVLQNDWIFAYRNPDPKVMHLLSHKYTFNAVREDQVLFGLKVLGSAKVLSEAFPDLRIPNRERFQICSIEGNVDAIAWMLKRCDYIQSKEDLEEEVQKLRKDRLASATTYAGVVSALCNSGDLGVENYLIEVIGTGKLRCLLNWLRKGGVLEYDKIFPKALYVSEMLVKSGPYRFLNSEGLFPNLEHFKKLISTPSLTVIASYYLEMGLHRDSPEVVPILSARTDYGLLEVALSNGYICPDGGKVNIPRAMTMAHKPLIQKRFQSEWKITKGDVLSYMGLAVRHKDSDSAVAALTSEFEGLLWIRHIRPFNENTSEIPKVENIVFSNDLMAFSTLVASLPSKESEALLKKGLPLFRNQYLKQSSNFMNQIPSGNFILAIKIGYSVPMNFFETHWRTKPFQDRKEELKQAILEAGLTPDYFKPLPEGASNFIFGYAHVSPDPDPTLKVEISKSQESTGFMHIEFSDTFKAMNSTLKSETEKAQTSFSFGGPAQPQSFGSSFGPIPGFPAPTYSAPGPAPFTFSFDSSPSFDPSPPQPQSPPTSPSSSESVFDDPFGFSSSASDKKSPSRGKKGRK